MSYFQMPFVVFLLLTLMSNLASAEQCADSSSLKKTFSVHMKEEKNGKATLSYVQKRLPIKGDEVTYLLHGDVITEEKKSLYGLFDKQIDIIVKETGKRSPWVSYSYDVETEGLLEKIRKGSIDITRIAHGAFGSEQKFTARLVKEEQLLLPIKKDGKKAGECSLNVMVIEFSYHDNQNLVVRYHYSTQLKMVLKKEEHFIKIYMGSMFSKKKKENAPVSTVRSADYIIVQ